MNCRLHNAKWRNYVLSKYFYIVHKHLLVARHRTAQNLAKLQFKLLRTSSKFFTYKHRQKKKSNTLMVFINRCEVVKLHLRRNSSHLKSRFSVGFRPTQDCMPLITVVNYGFIHPFSGISLFYILIEKFGSAMVTSVEETESVCLKR
jgi:hypothetical protein